MERALIFLILCSNLAICLELETFIFDPPIDQRNQPAGIAFSPQTNTYYISLRNSHIIVQTKDLSTWEKFCGINGTSGVNSGPCKSQATFDNPSQILIDTNGTMWIVDENPQLRKIVSIEQEPNVVVVAGTGNGFEDGLLLASKFEAITSIAFSDNQNIIFVADNNMVRQVDLDLGEVSTVVGKPIESGARDGSFANATFESVFLVFLADPFTLIAGEPNSMRKLDLDKKIAIEIESFIKFKKVISAAFNCNNSLILLGDTSINSIIQYNPLTGDTSIFAGTGSEVSSPIDGPISAARVDEPTQMVLIGDSLFIADADIGIRHIPGFCTPQNPIPLPPTPADPTIPIAVGASVGGTLFIFGICVVIFVVRKKRAKKYTKHTSSTLLTSESHNLAVTGVEIGVVIGQGNFSTVYKGTWGATTVACKLLKDANELLSFQAEAATMKSLSHPNIIQFYGIFTENSKSFLITEFCALGSLEHYIRNNSNPSLSELLSFASDCAFGMAYLSDKGILHRDLALRNVLIKKESKIVAKISDFGLSRFATDNYYVSDGKAAIAIKWTAPEAAEYRKFSVQTDVWSFGVLLWELFSGGKVPFASLSNQEAMEAVIKGERLEQPERCPDELWFWVMKCWEKTPNQRPSFETLHKNFASMIEKSDQTEVQVLDERNQENNFYATE